MCTWEATIDIQFVTSEVVCTESLECELKTTLIKHYIKSSLVAVHFASCEQAVSRDTCTCTEHVDISQSLSILATHVCISLSTVEDHLTPAANDRRRDHRLAILVRELRHVVDRAGVAILHCFVNTCEAVNTLVVYVILIVFAVNKTFLSFVGSTIVGENKVLISVKSTISSEMEATRIIVLSLRIWEVNGISIQTRILWVDERCVAGIHRITLVEVEERVRRIDLTPTNSLFIAMQVHRTDRRLAHIVADSLVCKAEENLRRSLCVDVEVSEVCVQLSSSVCTTEHSVNGVYALLPVLHIEVNA